MVLKMYFCCKTVFKFRLAMIDILIEIAIEAGITIRKIYESGKFSTSIKSDKTPVTTADEEANKTILKGLNNSFLRYLQYQRIRK